ncbi:MAG: sugar kinase [Erysipelotrichaceae bacterium]|nr:sugar kinase [Erysipelotrichaceae bacterium]
MSKKVVAFGEIMLRLTPPDYTTISEAKNFIANYGGAEANVLVSLSHLGNPTDFLTRVPNNQLGESAIMHLKRHGVGTDHILRGSSNLGMYFVETGFGGRPSKVIYNRAHSAITRIGEDDLDYDEIFKDAEWFHMSGITLAIHEKCRNVAYKCLEACEKYGVKVSFDFNYRSKLWTIEEAKPHFQKVIKYVDVLFANFFDLNTMLEIPVDPHLETPEEKRLDVAKKLMDQTKVKYLFGTDRIVHTATDNSLSSYCIRKDGICFKEGPIRFSIYDRIGGGDAFSSGIIHGLLKDYENPKYALKFGLATSVLKHTLYGDASVLSEEEVVEFMQTNGNAAVQR